MQIGEMPELLFFLQQLINATQLSAFYALLTVAYVLVYGVSGQVNLAFGSFSMWGAYTTLNQITLMVFLTGLPLPLIALLGTGLGIATTAAVAVAVDRLVARPLLGRRSLAMLVATIGLSILLEEAARIANSSRDKTLPPLFAQPIRLIASPVFPVQATFIQLLVTLLGFVLAGLLVWYATHSRFGRLWRACSQDIAMAALLGVDASRIQLVSYLLAGVSAGVSGAIIAIYYGSVSFYMGLMMGLKALFAAVLGGLTSFTGALIGAVVLAFVETFYAAYFGFLYRDVAVFVGLTLLLILRPDGLLERNPERV